MKAKIKLFATLRNGRFDISEMSFTEGTTILNVVEQLGIDKKDAAILFINGVHAELDSIINEGDDVAIFPPVGGG
ncbi:MAG TPA: MoaD/ThiS family protein [Spirochaetota bacterium]|nr:MoaD/ThiS family protein [Spirochaetota bacterium]HPF06952.1 MoaD/ThiS family protein [Spirochaetota bacterium]HPJ43853.1 MoaD/ThiS family protein [Spirochaetota bacterium]HPR38352.1 MoaD/ThiS family protein [Spirochaetota bacterium]